jgi:hypothetical protein
VCCSVLYYLFQVEMLEKQEAVTVVGRMWHENLNIRYTYLAILSSATHTTTMENNICKIWTR